VEQWLRQTPVAGARLDDCLDAETLAAWSEGLLEGRARSTAEAHAASCARCQAMLAIMVRTTPAPAGAIGSPLRKWLMMLSPAMAAAAAVALWVAVGQRPASPVIDELTKRQAKAERAAEVTPVTPAPAVGAEKEVDRKAPGGSLERDAPQLTADARRELSSRTGARTATDTGATAPLNERTEKKDVASARRADKSRDAERPRAVAEPAASPPPAAPPAVPSAPVESVAVAAATPPVKVAPPSPAPLQQANQAPNQNQAQTQNQNQSQLPNQNQAQTQNQNQAGQRQQAPGALEERVIVTSEQPRAGADNAAAKSAGRGGAGAAGGFADASVLRARANAGAFDIAVPESSTRWRIADGRTIQRSLDAGVTWANHHTGENDLTLTAGAAPSSNVCWLVGRSGAILLTTDGRAWRRITFIETADLTAVTSPDARTATVTTADGRQFGTTDGGRTWTRR
jgi:hypothetical protein